MPWRWTMIQVGKELSTIGAALCFWGVRKRHPARRLCRIGLVIAHMVAHSVERVRLYPVIPLKLTDESSAARHFVGRLAIFVELDQRPPDENVRHARCGFDGVPAADYRIRR